MSATTSVNSKSRICQGEIFYIMPYGETADTSTFYGGRPAIIISNDMINEYNGVVSVIYLTRHLLNKLPTHVVINATTQRSWAICDQISTVSKKRIGKYVGQCSQFEMESIKKAISVALSADINDFKSKNIEEVLKLYAENLKAGATDDEISEYPVEDFETPDREKLKLEKTNIPDKSLSDHDVNEKPAANNNGNENLTDIEYIDEKTANIIRLQAERDTYKNMYEQLLSRLINT